MTAGPQLLRGAQAIGQWLGIGAPEADHMIRQGRLPTFRAGGAPYATPAALEDWQHLSLTGRLPTN